jgi:hypothetical protein
VKVLFLRDPVEIEVVFEVRKIPPKVLNALRARAVADRAALLREWSQKVGQ